MNYDLILDKIRPNQEEINKNIDLANKLIEFINDTCKNENIEAKAILVGSVAKGTFLSGKSDIDIFISFPLSTSMEYLEEKGLYLGYKANDFFNGKSIKNYASHPYLISEINGSKIDFVPCYDIGENSHIKSAVDRTILHTKYIKKNLKKTDEVLLLKKFMEKTKTYGSENKVGGFAGYLCELLILRYETFENTLNSAANWKFGTSIDLESFGTIKQFNHPLIVIDPTDKNRNVAASLMLDTYSSFINATRNYLSSNDDIKAKYFEDLDKEVSLNDIKNQFKERETLTHIITFNIPDIVHDALHPQLKKTLESICEKLDNEGFSVFKSDYWANDEGIAIFLIEMNIHKLSNVKIHYGPKIFAKKACNNFLEIHSEKNCYTLGDFLVFTEKSEFENSNDYIKHLLSVEHSHKIKIGKNIKEDLLNTYKIASLDDYLINNQTYEFLDFLDDFLNPGQYQKR